MNYLRAYSVHLFLYLQALSSTLASVEEGLAFCSFVNSNKTNILFSSFLDTNLKPRELKEATNLETSSNLDLTSAIFKIPLC
jgi:hypothetical protein